MRLTVRFVLPLVGAIALLAWLVFPFVDRLMIGWSYRDLDTRSTLVANTLEVPLAELLAVHDNRKVVALLERATRDERLYALGLCDDRGHLIAATVHYPSDLACAPAPGPRAARVANADALYVSKFAIAPRGETLATLVLMHDTSFMVRRSSETRTYVFVTFAVLAILVAFITVLVAHLSWRGWVQGVRELLAGGNLLTPFQNASPEVMPLVADLERLMRDIDRDRVIREETTIRWDADTLRMILREQLFGDEILVVSNREPYIHAHGEHGIVVKRPASGLVTAVEPVMRACSGTWIAHGGGDADREVVDAHDRVPVPPGDPRYTLKRIWLTEDEERGYYYGFANEGLWPLCHIAHVRPVFRTSDWEQYVAVNRRFADAVVQEARTSDPVVLVQDYHFALLPKMIRERLPRATVIMFWHIPWPNPESFGICPWRNELLDGLLGSAILGFHTAYHGKNFLETVDRFLETRITLEESIITYRGHRTRVCDYPISIHWPGDDPLADEHVHQAHLDVREALGLPRGHVLGLGIDRLDYTKGILERFNGIERMLEKHPEQIGRFTLLQIAAPSRSTLDEYRAFERRVCERAERINARFAGAAAPPIVLQVEHRTSEEVHALYLGCDVCVVTSLHDGMNLVAKEFVAARADERGVLILSRFAGAAGELSEALIVNPYHIEQVADALHQAVTMGDEEQHLRMRSLRGAVRDFNIYRWAGRMLLDASRERLRARVRERIDESAQKELA